mmetsp:Transcript_7820/g.22961  ORF Transcript_7820/g.22961 Transcript_7820/m.22961 type:complete len:777 (+) Transcript_7820:400-2730(+)
MEDEDLAAEIDGSGNDVGPIRLRIQSFTIILQPLSQGLTDAEAINVRNTIESVLQNYFFEVQPWAVTTENGSSNDWEGDDDFGTSFSNSISQTGATGATRNREIPFSDGAVTYVGLAQILENKYTEQGAELTMNGLVYFAEGSKNIPDENELLQTMERDALGDSALVVEALKDYFPSLQLVTVETSVATLPPTNEPSRPTEPSEPPDAAPSTLLPQTTQPPLDQTANEVVAITGGSDGLGGITAALAGGICAAMVLLALVLGMFVARQNSRKPRKGGDAGDDAYLVQLDDTEKRSGLAEGDWKAYSNNMLRMLSLSSSNTSDKLDGNGQDTTEDAPSSPAKGNDSNPSTPSKKADISEAASTPLPSSPPNPLAYISSFFQKATNPYIEQNQELGSLSSAERTKESADANHSNSSSNSHQHIHSTLYDFMDGDGNLSDFDDTVSIQPHVVALHSLESFEEQHKGMTRQELVVQKDQLESSFERRRMITPPAVAPVTNIATGASAESNLSYSSSSMSSREQPHTYAPSQGVPGMLTVHTQPGKRREQLLEETEQREDQRIRYSMMPNPYVRKNYPEDRSAHCVLQATEITAASLRSGSSGSSSAGSSTGLDMIPKMTAPSWWASSSTPSGNKPHRRRKSNKERRLSTAAAAANVYSDDDNEDDLAYSGDEENTFGVPGSDGWDPADTELSSMGDAPTQEDLNMVLFHPTVGNQPGQSVLNHAVRQESVKLQRKRTPTGASTSKNRFQNSYAIEPHPSYSSEEDETTILRFDSSYDMEI